MMRHLSVLNLVCLGAILWGSSIVHGQSIGTIVAWGANDYGQCNVPSPNADFVGGAAGEWHSLAFKSDGTIVAWGFNYHGQCNVPVPNADFVAVAAGYAHSLGLKSDGTIVAWGENHYGQCQRRSSLSVNQRFKMSPFQRI